MVTVWWIVALLVWNAISPWYGQVLASAGTAILNKNPLTHTQITFRSEKTNIKADAYFTLRQAPDGETVLIEGSPSWDGRQSHFSFTVWMALIMATPFGGYWTRKLRWFVGGWAVVFLTQVLYMFLQVVHQNFAYVETQMSSGQFLPPSGVEIGMAAAARYLLLVGNVLFPLLVWLPIGVSRLKTASTDRGEPAAPPRSVRLTT